MKQTGILFKAPMVRAILEGRKSQTRRIIDPQPNPKGSWLTEGDKNATTAIVWCDVPDIDRLIGKAPKWNKVTCPYGKPGDQLWVRETWRCRGGREYEYQQNQASICYRADAEPLEYVCKQWRPSIHMPRWASRITLEIVSVRVERLNAIDAYDAESEGCGCGVNDETGGPVARYKNLWESINGPGSWNLNPWVWVIEFKEVKP